MKPSKEIQEKIERLLPMGHAKYLEAKKASGDDSELTKQERGILYNAIGIQAIIHYLDETYE